MVSYKLINHSFTIISSAVRRMVGVNYVINKYLLYEKE